MLYEGFFVHIWAWVGILVGWVLSLCWSAGLTTRVLISRREEARYLGGWWLGWGVALMGMRPVCGCGVWGGFEFTPAVVWILWGFWGVAFFLSFVLGLGRVKINHPLGPGVVIWALWLGWGVVGLEANIVTKLLWLELIVLLGAALLLGLGESTQLTVGRRADNHALQAIVLLLWVSGLSTLLLLWGVSITWSVWLGGVGVSTHLSQLLVFVGISLKLMIPPFQSLLFKFYRSLTPAALAAYMVGYYLPLVCGFIFFVLPSLVVVSGGWYWVLSVALVGFIAPQLRWGWVLTNDLNVVLAWSTALNLGVLLLAALL